jgi:hypothetical protein
VRAARDRAGALGLADLIGGALAAHADRDDQVAALVARHPDGGSRSLLLASAMFEGHRAEEVLEAQRSMVRILDVTTEFEHEFEKASLTHRFSQVEAEVDGNAAVRFPRPGYAEAIRRHFWSNYPALRGGLQRWAVECGSRMFGPGDDGDEFAQVHRCVL